MEKNGDLAGKKIRKMENKVYHYLCAVKKQKAGSESFKDMFYFS